MTPPLTRRLTWLLAVTTGILVANLYYAQPLTAAISSSLGLEAAVAGLVVTLTQAGYGLGVLALVPLGDLVENRKLILTLIAVAIVALLAVALSSNLALYFGSAFVLGISLSVVQIVVPYTAHLAPEHIRGRAVGNLMSGLMIGIMLSRPISGFLSDWFSWHAVFYLSAAVMTALWGVLYFFLPRRETGNTRMHYLDLIKSLGPLWVDYPVLRRRSLYQACMFAAFCLFWTASPLVLAGPEFGFSPTQIAIFALVGVGGAILAPIAGSMADRGWVRSASIGAMLSGSLSFCFTHLAPLGTHVSLALFTLCALLLDGGVSANLVLGQREIFSLPAEFRGRINSIHIATIFIGGAFGSFIGAWAYARGGWNLTSWVGAGLPLVCLLYLLTDRKR